MAIPRKIMRVPSVMISDGVPVRVTRSPLNVPIAAPADTATIAANDGSIRMASQR